MAGVHVRCEARASICALALFRECRPRLEAAGVTRYQAGLSISANRALRYAGGLAAGLKLVTIMRFAPVKEQFFAENGDSLAQEKPQN